MLLTLLVLVLFGLVPERQLAADGETFDLLLVLVDCMPVKMLRPLIQGACSLDLEYADDGGRGLQELFVILEVFVTLLSGVLVILLTGFLAVLLGVKRVRSALSF